MMHHRSPLARFAAIAVAVSCLNAGPAAVRAAAYTIDLTVYNKSSHTFTKLVVNESEEPGVFGDYHEFLEGKKLSPGASFPVQRAGGTICVYDVQAFYDDDKSFLKTSVNLCTSKVVTFTDDDREVDVVKKR